MPIYKITIPAQVWRVQGDDYEDAKDRLFDKLSDPTGWYNDLSAGVDLAEIEQDKDQDSEADI